MNFKLIEKITLVCMIIFALVLGFIFDSSWAVGFLIGGLAGIFSFKLLYNRVERLNEISLMTFKRALRSNRIQRLGIYLAVLLIAALLPNWCNIFAVLGGIVLLKVALAVESLWTKEEGVIID